MTDREERNEKTNEAQQSENRTAEIQSMTIPVIEEKLLIDKEIRETGRIKVEKKVHEIEEIVEIPVTNEESEVERVAVNQYINTPPPAIRQEGDTTIIPVLKEVTVVEKRLFLVEEVRVTKRKIHSEGSQPISLRREEVTVKRMNKDNKNQI